MFVCMYLCNHENNVPSQLLSQLLTLSCWKGPYMDTLT